MSRAIRANENRDSDQIGQAMVEFAFLLLLLLTLCAGMLYQSRMLDIHYWAQQEARFIAFEQTWAPASARANPINFANTKARDRAFFHKPKIIDELEVSRTGESSGSVSDLSFNFRESPLDRYEPAAGVEDAPVMYASAKRSIWHERSSEWTFGLEDKIDVVASAFASQDSPLRRGGRRSSVPVRDERTRALHDAYLPDNQLERAFVQYLEFATVGEQVCEAMNRVLDRANAAAYYPAISANGCAARINREFGIQLARNVNFQDAFREYESQLDWGLDQAEALEKTTEIIISRQFYSLFDNLVKFAQNDIVSGTFLSVQGVLSGLSFFDESVTRMESDLRYIGSTAAIVAMQATVGMIAASNPLDHNQAGEKTVEDNITTITHTDVTEAGYLLNPTYLPVPPTFGGTAPAMFEGLMTNVLWQDDDLRTKLIEESNKTAEVNYDPANGLFPAITSRFNTTNKSMKSKFFLVTEPWHITRRETPTGPYRQLGDQNSSNDDVDDEGIMRRRVSGLYMFPKRPGALLRPLTEIPGMGFLTPVVSAIEALDPLLGMITGIIDDNVFLDFLRGLKDIPGIGSFVPAPPQWPAVRPQAYPRSVELKNDKMVRDETRDFQKYVTEQRGHNPPPKPDFGDAN